MKGAEDKKKIEGIISYIFGIKNGEVYIKEGRNIFKDCITIIRDRLFYKHSKNVSKTYINSLVMTGVYNSLIKKRGIYRLEEYEEDVNKRNELYSYFYSKVGFEVIDLLNEDNGVKRLETGKGKVSVVLDCDSLNEDRGLEGVEDIITEDNNFMAKKEYETGNAKNKAFKSIKEGLLTKNQLRYYNALSEDYIDGRHYLNSAGYKSKKEYILTKGLSPKGYYSFKENVNKRARHIYEGGCEMFDEGVLSIVEKIINILEDEELEEEQVDYLISKYIQKNYDKEGFELLITKDLKEGEKKEVVKLVKSLEGVVVIFKEDRLQGDEKVKYLSNKVMYKVVNNLYDYLDANKEVAIEEIKKKEEGYKTAVLEEYDTSVVRLTGYGFEPINSEYRS